MTAMILPWLKFALCVLLLVSLSHRAPPRGYDEPQTLPYAISSICPVGPDGEQTGLVVGVFIGGWHVIWSILVGIGWGQPPV